MTPPRLELRGVGHAYGGRVVLAGVERVLEPGRALGLLGPNGSGKSTLLRCIAGLLRPRAGHVLVDGRESCELRAGASARASPTPGIGRCSGAGSARARTSSSAPGLYGLGDDVAERALASAGLAETAERPAAALSQGQRQRLALARALLPEPALLVLDEPHSGLDEASQRSPRRTARRRARDDDDRARDTRARSRRAAVRRAARARGAALSAHARLVRPRGRAARAHRPHARAPGAAARARDGPLRRGRAGRAALRRRHRATAGGGDRRLALGHAPARDPARRRPRLQRRARRGAARRARARAHPAHGDLGGQGDRDRRAAPADGGRRGAARVPLPARRRARPELRHPRCSRCSRATSASPRWARSWPRWPPPCAVAR